MKDDVRQWLAQVLQLLPADIRTHLRKVRRSIHSNPIDPTKIPHPLQAYIHEACEQTPESRPETRVLKSDYLNLAASITNAFVPFHKVPGFIEDPFAKREVQYSTPAFAFALSYLIKNGLCEEALRNAKRALEYSVACISKRSVPDDHEDFFVVYVLDALTSLQDKVNADELSNWLQILSSLNPREFYRRQPSREDFNNWNLVALCGEMLRSKHQVDYDFGWFENCLAIHRRRLDEFGLYGDLDLAIAYDSFARFHIVKLLFDGYSGRQFEDLRVLSERGAWTALFMQSPHGEIPGGGRTSHHQWNESAALAVFEYYATKFAREDRIREASAFKRAAQLSFQSLRRWIRADGDLFIVKNKSSAELRHGFERYSYHSQYNLMVAAQLCAAHRYADDSIAPGACPADTGKFVFEHKRFAICIGNVGGHYVQVKTAPDGRSTAGLLRVHKRGVNPQLTVSDGVPPDCRFELPEKPSRAVALCPEWMDRNGHWHSLGGQTDVRSEVHLEHRADGNIEIRVTYHLAAAAVRLTETVLLSSQWVDVTDSVAGDAVRLRQCFPLFLNDGCERMIIDLDGPQVTVAHYEPEQGAICFRTLHPVVLNRLNSLLNHRNGSFDIAFAESEQLEMTFRMTPLPGK